MCQCVLVTHIGTCRTPITPSIRSVGATSYETLT